MKIAIDGPSASGKGTLTKLLAEKIGAKYLNTGKLYRVVAFSIDKNFDVTQQAIAHSENIEKYLEKFGENNEIYSQENGMLASKIATLPKVRENLLDFQRSFAEINNPVILEGRDIGTHILPDADYKFFITANTDERAKRRHKQNVENGLKSGYEDVLKAIAERDAQDKNRKESPLVQADDAIVIDTTNASVDDSLALIMQNIGK
jgi:cytidylate kinase